MGKRFVTVPAKLDFAVFDPVTEEPAHNEKGEPITGSWGHIVRATLLDDRVREKLDVFEINDLRMKLTRVKPGDVVEVDDKEIEALRPALARSTLHHAFLYSGGIEMLRAIHDAPTKDPRHVEANGAAASA